MKEKITVQNSHFQSVFYWKSNHENEYGNAARKTDRNPIDQGFLLSQ